VELQPMPLLGATKGRVDWVLVVLLAFVVISIWLDNWPVAAAVAMGIAVRWWILRGYVTGRGVIEHEIDEDGARRGAERWAWGDFRSFWILYTKKDTVLELILNPRNETQKPLKLVLPSQGLRPALSILDRHLPREDPKQRVVKPISR